MPTDLTPEDLVRENCARAAAMLASGNRAISLLRVDAAAAAAALIAILDPRTPPGEVGRAMLLVGSHAGRLLYQVHDGDTDAIHQDAAVVLNVLALTGYELLNLAGDLPGILAIPAPGGDPS